MRVWRFDPAFGRGGAVASPEKINVRMLSPLEKTDDRVPRATTVQIG
ncbi:hypothetical protein Z948_855 [Sulfitobacter donghicola DSW-25 = KCTC 12864 = JCM 14565]|nr:hypothetical protein Z948_855 [Sulfitobacter donghicola DSW-25 = KCTC 12864 = JCM 14565]